MTDISLNHWPVLRDGDPRLATGVIPGTKRKITINKIALPLFLHFAAAWEKEMPARLKLSDPRNEVDSWEVRTARNSSGYSNHSSATATDFAYRILLADNAHHMTSQEQDILVRILARYHTADGHHVLANGYAWGKCDEMHTELSQGWDVGALRYTTPGDVVEVIKRLGIRPDGTSAVVVPSGKVPYPGKPFTTGSHGSPISEYQRGLRRRGYHTSVTGIFDAQTTADTLAYKKAHPWLWPFDGKGASVGARTYASVTR